ncbi:MAG: DUF1801 domain-containing protein [Flavobacteriales bacterium]|nr:MAG: DUF1801 domain-containing protein [Flavobacteriales bacterium]
MVTRFDPAVHALLDANQHPLRKEIDQLRTIILGADKSIEEGVKWNAASFKTADWFATLNGPKQLKEPMLILHAGAKAKGIVLKDRIPDPEGLIKWLGNDRGQVIFKDASDIKAKQKALQTIISAWIQLI